jgi:hypothetical protein
VIRGGCLGASDPISIIKRDASTEENADHDLKMHHEEFSKCQGFMMSIVEERFSVDDFDWL